MGTVHWFEEIRDLSDRDDYEELVQSGKLYRSKHNKNVHYLYLGEGPVYPPPGGFGTTCFSSLASQLIDTELHIRYHWFYKFPDRLSENDTEELKNVKLLYCDDAGNQYCHGGKHFLLSEAQNWGLQHPMIGAYKGGQWEHMEEINLRRC